MGRSWRLGKNRRLGRRHVSICWCLGRITGLAEGVMEGRWPKGRVAIAGPRHPCWSVFRAFGFCGQVPAPGSFEKRGAGIPAPRSEAGRLSIGVDGG